MRSLFSSTEIYIVFRDNIQFYGKISTFFILLQIWLKNLSSLELPLASLR